MVLAITIFVVWIILGIFSSIPFYRMLNILVENDVGSRLYCYWKLWLSLGFFRKFINESDLDLEQKEKYLSLYKKGLYVKRTIIIFFFSLILFGILSTI